MRKYLTSNPIQQMPQISGKGRLDAKPLFQLSRNRFDQSAFAREDSNGLLGQGRVLLVPTMDRGVEIDLTFVPQFLL